MKGRPLGVLCLVLIIIQTTVLFIRGGDCATDIPAASIFSRMEDGEKRYQVRVQGRVFDKECTSKNQILYLEQNSITDHGITYKESKLILYGDGLSEYAIGETVLVSGTLQKYEGARNPGNFDQKLYYARQKLYGRVFDVQVLARDGCRESLSDTLCELRQQWKRLIYKHMSEEQGPVLAAMLLGDKADMEGDIKELYQKNGISHVLAISGLHISFIGLGIYRLLRKLRMGYVPAGISAFLVLTGYVVMIGFSASVFRAYVMLLFRLGADMTGRVYDMLTALLVSAAVAVTYEPLSLTDAAFLLSYGAIIAILFVLLPIQKNVPQRFCNLLAGCISGVAIQLFLLPIILLYYFEISLTSFLLNIVVIPLTSWVLGLGIYGSLLSIVWEWAGGGLLHLCDLILCLFNRLGEKGVSIPFARITFGKPHILLVVLYYALFLLALWWLLYRKKKTLAFAGCALLLCLLFVRLPNGKLQVAMLDVGQGDCIFMKMPNGRTCLMDGGSSDVNEVGKYRMEPFLKSQGVGTLDYVFVSHGDADHCNGIRELISRQKVGVRVKQLILPSNYQSSEELMELARIAGENRIQVAVIRAGTVIEMGAVRLTCLQPYASELEGNAGSMVLEVCFQEFEMLLTGDLEKEGEELLCTQNALRKYDVLKVAHHGSKYASGEELLEKIKPRIALVSAGKGNSYGHPHAEVLGRLKEASCRILQTMDYGAIRLETDGDFIDIFPSSI